MYIHIRKILVAVALWLPVWCSPIVSQVRTTVPYVIDTYGKLVVQASVNGVKGRFLLDTGAPCCISHSFAQKVGVVAGRSLQGEDSNGQSVQANLLVLDSLQLGSISFKQLQVLQWAEGSVPEQLGIDGIVGYNLMRLGIVKFDGRNRHFTFTTALRPPSSGKFDLDAVPSQAIPLVPHPYLPVLPINMGNNVSDSVMFDTGAVALYEMSAQSYHRLKHTQGIVTLASGRGVLSLGAAGVEQASEKFRIKIPKFTLGSSSFADATTITTNARHSRLGADLLRYGDVIIDFGRQLFYYLPHDTLSTPNLYEKEWEVVLTVINNQLTAGMVWNNKLPIRCGDRIVAVNGKRYPHITLAQAQSGGVDMPGDEATITFVNSATGKEQTITIFRQ